MVGEAEEALMCIPGDYWHKKGVDKPCGTFTVAEVQEAYKAKYANHIADGTWTKDQFVEWFPRDRAKMTQEEVRAFADASAYIEIAPNWDTQFYCSMNSGVTSIVGITGITQGHMLMNRSGASAEQYYQNATEVDTSTNSSSAMVSQNIYILARNVNGSANAGTANQISAATIGSSLSGADVTALHGRLATYRTAVGL